MYSGSKMGRILFIQFRLCRMRKSVLPGFFFISGPAYCDEALLIFNRLTGEQPSTALKQLINEVISYNKEDGTHQLADCYYIRGVHTAELACQNWAKNAHNSTLVNSPTFVSKQGIRGNGIIAYINNNYNAYVDGINYKMGDSTLIVLCKELGTADTKYMLGAQETGTPQKLIIITYKLSGNEYVYINGASSYQQINILADKINGYTRDGNNIQGYIDGIPVGFNQTLLQADRLPNLSIYELGGNQNGNIVAAYNGMISFSFYGKKLTASNHNSIYNRVKYFYDNVGGTF